LTFVALFIDVTSGDVTLIFFGGGWDIVDDFLDFFLQIIEISFLEGSGKFYIKLQYNN
jgi:hypothetical protein